MGRALAFLLTVVAGGLLVVAATRADSAPAKRVVFKPGPANCSNCHVFDPDAPPRAEKVH